MPKQKFSDRRIIIKEQGKETLRLIKAKHNLKSNELINDFGYSGYYALELKKRLKLFNIHIKIVNHCDFPKVKKDIMCTHLWIFDEEEKIHFDCENINGVKDPCRLRYYLDNL